MEKNSKIYVSGHNGLLGSALVEELKNQGYNSLILKERSELDLIDQKSTSDFFSKEAPDYVFMAAGKVGGIKANMSFPAEFIYENLQIQNNVMHFSHKYGVKKLLFVGSNCMYPAGHQEALTENLLLTGRPEPTNEAFAIAKIAGMSMVESYRKQYGSDFITVIPANLFGPRDHFQSENAHFIPSLISKLHKAKERGESGAEFWGTGTPRREVIYVDDAARACIWAMNHYMGKSPINAGIERDYTIREIAETAKEVIGFPGELRFDSSKPDGIMRKLLDSSKITKLGWKPTIGLKEGLEMTYAWYQKDLK